jgi:ABC-2 type transport system permease protein
MMKILDIAFKDLKQTFQNIFSLIMMLGAPLLITGLLYFAFGGLANGAGEFNLPKTQVEIVDQDQNAVQGRNFDASGMLLSFLEDEQIENIMEFSLAENEAAAREAVAKGKADIALIIPSDFTAAALTPGKRATVILYQDPTLTIGPSILEDLLTHFMDGFSGAKIASNVTAQQLGQHEIVPDNGLNSEISGKYAKWLETSGHNQSGEVETGINFVSPTGAETTSDPAANMIGSIMSGMLVFFIFFMAASGTQSIIREHEQGTLARLFTTPTSTTKILGGKFVGVLLTIVIQAVLLLAASSLIFGIYWGQPMTVMLVTFGLLVVATGFGILVISFIKNTRQTGPVLGGVLTLTGMLGGLFTNGIPNMPPAFDTVRLSMPQGWAMTAWERSLTGVGPAEVLLPVSVMLVLGIVFFTVGVMIFRRRFA